MFRLAVLRGHLVAHGMDAHTLEKHGIQSADAFLAVTQGDNRNYFASQMAREVYTRRQEGVSI